MRISSPPFLNPCYYGTDIDSREHLIACRHSVLETAQIIGADSLAYLNLDRLSELAPGLSVCQGCFTGRYPMEPPSEDIRGDYEK